jgi:hypothetical protein
MYAVSNWEKVTAVATAVGGVGAMLGAIAAWLAARKSSEASRDAKDALAASFKPQVMLTITQLPTDKPEAEPMPVFARAWVVGPLSPAGLAGVLPAADVQLEFTLASGRRGSSGPVTTLEPSGSRWGQQGPYLNVEIGRPTDDWPPPAGDRAVATVAYSDMRRVARYKKSMAVDLHPSGQPGLVSHRNVVEGPETRIS